VAKLRIYPINEEALLGLIQAGHNSPVLQARLRYAEAQQVLTHYLEKLKAPRIYPNMLPTQASGRWSTTNPPLTNMPKTCLEPAHAAWPEHVPRTPECWSVRDCIIPDPGEQWLHWDWDQIEAKLVSAYTNDRADLEAYSQGWDIHTLTAIAMYKWPTPSCAPRKKLLFGPEGAAWRADLEARGAQYEDADCRTRRLAKNCRYAMAYGPDEKAMDKYAQEMGMSVTELRAGGRAYLASKPWLTAWKRKTWESIARNREARTFLGRRRRFMGRTYDIQKEGLNHIIQGGVADIMNDTLIKIHAAYPEVRLVYQAHDGATLAFPRSRTDFSGVYSIVERSWSIAGHDIKMTAEYDIKYAPEEA
jgi:DNA polymerase I-like protein with 3'-5' exonuclease and polymerase domains